jgi:hypothetical protein
MAAAPSYRRVRSEINQAFDEWAGWAGSLAPEEQEAFRKEVEGARQRAMAYLKAGHDAIKAQAPQGA